MSDEAETQDQNPPEEAEEMAEESPEEEPEADEPEEEGSSEDEEVAGYREALEDVKGVGEKTASSIMEVFPTPLALRAGLDSGEYSEAFKDSFASQFENELSDVFTEDFIAGIDGMTREDVFGEAKILVVKSESGDTIRVSHGGSSHQWRPYEKREVPRSIEGSKEFQKLLNRGRFGGLVVVETK